MVNVCTVLYGVIYYKMYNGTVPRAKVCNFFKVVQCIFSCNFFSKLNANYGPPPVQTHSPPGGAKRKISQ